MGRGSFWDASGSGRIQCRRSRYIDGVGFNACYLLRLFQTGSVDQAHKILPEVMERAKNVFVHVPSANLPSSSLSRYLYKAELLAHDDVPQSLRERNARSLKYLMNQLRAIKSEAEVRNMRKAGRYSGNAFTDLMSIRATSESDAATILEYRFRMQGCDRSAYVPVIAGGEVYFQRESCALNVAKF